MAIQSSIAQILGLELLKEKTSLKIPFEYKHKFIVLDVKMSNIPLNFLYDTGAEHVILFKKELSDILRFKYERPQQLLGSDLQRTLVAYITRSVPIQLENTESVNRDIIVLEEDFLHMDEITGASIDGLVGARFFRGLIVEIDYRKKHIVLYKSLPRKVEKQNYVKLSSHFINHKPYINCILEDQVNTITTDVLLDTGAGIPFLLFLNDQSKVKLPTNYMLGNLGKGIGGDIKGYIGKTEKFHLGDDLFFENLITNFQFFEKDSLDKYIVTRDGLLGNPILERFNVVIDYIKGDIYLKPGKKYNKKIEYDISGLVLYAFGQDLSDYFVKEVIPNSPAERAGIEEGDIIKKVGILSTKYYDLEQLYRKLIRRKGKKIRLTIERNNQKLKKILILTDNL